jgi:ATP-dependent Clp protease ATP-binding subunit ClpB
MQPTNPNQFTEKAWEAIAHTPDIVKEDFCFLDDSE